jgi:hypothetical protein
MGCSVPTSLALDSKTALALSRSTCLHRYGEAVAIKAAAYATPRGPTPPTQMLLEHGQVPHSAIDVLGIVGDVALACCALLITQAVQVKAARHNTTRQRAGMVGASFECLPMAAEPILGTWSGKGAWHVRVETKEWKQLPACTAQGRCCQLLAEVTCLC